MLNESKRLELEQFAPESLRDEASLDLVHVGHVSIVEGIDLIFGATTR